MSEILMKLFWLTEGESGLLGVKFPEEFSLCSDRILDGLNTTGSAIFTRNEQVKIAKAYRAFCRAVGRKASQGKKLPWESEFGPWAEFEDLRNRVGYYADLFRSRGRGPVPRPRKILLLTEEEQLEFWE